MCVPYWAHIGLFSCWKPYVLPQSYFRAGTLRGRNFFLKLCQGEWLLSGVLSLFRPHGVGVIFCSRTASAWGGGCEAWTTGAFPRSGVLAHCGVLALSGFLVLFVLALLALGIRPYLTSRSALYSSFESEVTGPIPTLESFGLAGPGNGLEGWDELYLAYHFIMCSRGWFGQTWIYHPPQGSARGQELLYTFQQVLHQPWVFDQDVQGSFGRGGIRRLHEFAVQVSLVDNLYGMLDQFSDSIQDHHLFRLVAADLLALLCKLSGHGCHLHGQLLLLSLLCIHFWPVR